MASNSYQNEVPKARVNIRLDLHTGGAQKKVELPLKLMVMGDYSNGREQRALSARGKVNVNKLNFDSVLGEFNPQLGDIPDSCFAIQGMAAGQPVAGNDSEAGRAANRRVDIQIVPQMGACTPV
jgi:hypothetical protein